MAVTKEDSTMRLATFLVSVCLATTTVANTSGYFSGTSLTNGTASNKFSVNSTAYNPASGSIVVRSDERFRVGYMANLGFANELGDVQNFEEELNDLVDTLDEEVASLDDATSLLNRFNAVLPILGESGYLKLQGGVSFPLFPVTLDMPMLKGSLVFDLGSELLVRGSVLDDELVLNPISNNLQTNTALYLKSGTLLKAGVSYSRPVWSYNEGHLNGTLYWGSRLNVYSMSLSKQVIGLESIEDDDVGDVIQDDYDTNEVSSTDFGIDQGLLWVADKYQVGLTIKNINEPEFDYGVLGQHCESITNTNSQANCFVARFHAENLGSLSLGEFHTMHAYTTLDASYLIMPRWLVSVAIDLSEYEDFVGDDLQLFTLSTAYQPDNIWVPGARLGYRSNQVGSELSSVSLGVTLFGVANLDIEYGLEDTVIDGSSAPRKLGLNLGFEERF